MAQQLQDYIDNLSSLELADAIKAMIELIPSLTTTVSPTAERLISHPAYEGTGNLDTLGRAYINAASRCHREHAPFKLRLLHTTLDPMFESLYVKNEDILRKGLKEKTVKFPPLDPNEVACCAHCRGDPDAVILAGFVSEDALYFDEEEYRKIWGDQPEHGSSHSATETRLKASKEQIEEAISRTSML